MSLSVRTATRVAAPMSAQYTRASVWPGACLQSMRLSEVFPQPTTLAGLIQGATALDDFDEFAVRSNGATAQHARDHRALVQAVAECASGLAGRAGVEPGPEPDPAARPCFGGQQPYVDYYPAVLAKLDALQRLGGSSFFGFADYAAIGSDPWMIRSRLPSPARRDSLLPLRIHKPGRALLGRDLRFVPPPSASTLTDVREQLKGLITVTAKTLQPGGFPKAAASIRLSRLMDDYEQARVRARHAGDFNSIWSARVFSRLGLQARPVLLSELLASERLLPSMAATLAVFVERNDLFIESIDEVLRRDTAGEIRFAPRKPGHLPIALTDPASGLRRPLTLKHRGRDCVLTVGDGAHEAFNVGRGGPAELEAFLRSVAGRWSPDVFVPIFLFFCGVAGIVNGRGSIRYSLVIAHVMQRLFGEAHPPNLLCSCNATTAGPFVDAVRAATAALPEPVADWEPTLVARLLCADEHRIRQEIAASWLNRP